MAPVAELLADRYEVGTRLGSGGMGDVYRARDRLLERPVAVKVPSTVTPAAAERFKREARAAARLNHPNVVGVYDWDGGPQPFIVMEFVEGRSLRAELRERHRLPPAEVAVIGAQIADALAHAHHHGVIHRDVKPSNVLLTPGGSVKVTDFGIAQSTAGEALTEPGVVLGTVGYLSPEQTAGLPADARSDVYSLGVVLTELLTGERPTGGEAPPATELERVVARARAADPSARYQEAAELRDALRAAVAPGAGAPPAPPGRPLVAGPPDDAGTASGTRTARATGVAVTSVLPAAAAGAAALTPPPRTGPSLPAPEARRRGKAQHRKLEKQPKPPKPMKPMKPAKPKRRDRKVAAGAATAAVSPPVPLAPAPTPGRTRTWKLRHWVAVLAAPLVLVAAAVGAYAVFVDHPPSVSVPDVVDRDVTTAGVILDQAGLRSEVHWADSARPGGTILAQQPTNGHQADQGSTVVLTVSRDQATVPDVSNRDIASAKVALAAKGLQNLTITPDYRADVDPGTVMRTNPAAYAEAKKAAPLEVIVATDPHVKLPSTGVIGADQASATTALRNLGLEVAVQTASSRTVSPGVVLKTSPGAGSTVVRGDTVTLTVSSGPKQVNVRSVVGWDRDDAVSKLEDDGFNVSVGTTAVTSGKDVDKVVAQAPNGGQIAEGSTVTITVGVRK